MRQLRQRNEQLGHTLSQLTPFFLSGMPPIDMSTLKKSATIGDYAFCYNINANLVLFSNINVKLDAEVASTATA